MTSHIQTGIIFTTWLIFLLPMAISVQLERCEAAQLLYHRYNFRYEDLAQWLCIIRWESEYKTDAVSSSGDYGLFQLNGQSWCQQPGKWSQNSCKIPCSKFTDSNLDDDIECVNKIYAIKGFKSWGAWRTHCQDRNRVQKFIEGCRL